MGAIEPKNVILGVGLVTAVSMATTPFLLCDWAWSRQGMELIEPKSPQRTHLFSIFNQWINAKEM